jgi:hypothetical protein
MLYGDRMSLEACSVLTLSEIALVIRLLITADKAHNAVGSRTMLQLMATPSYAERDESLGGFNRSTQHYSAGGLWRCAGTILPLSVNILDIASVP